MSRSIRPRMRDYDYGVFAFLLLAGSCQTRAALTPPQVQNIRVAQRPGTMFVDITYDLVDPDSTNIYVIAEFSSDGGTTYGLPIYSLSGDIGPVRPGTGRHIVWNAWNDWAGNMQRLSPNRNVYISRGFWIGRFEVTQGEYMALMGSNPSFHGGNTNRPVEQVSWNDAVQFCQSLTDRERAAGHINFNWAYRLPTEAEWEYACRAGTTNQFPYGDEPGFVRLQAYAWYGANSGNRTQPVGAKVPNQWGLFDMMGNVWEWCSDYIGGLDSGNFTDPQGPESGSYHMIRGGGYREGPSMFAFDRSYSEARYPFGPKNVDLGFRVVLAPTP
jgi:formylglycine-generating enzyme required for sulfatase activity